MSHLTLGRFWPVESFWHRRDPRTKLAVLLGLVVAAVAARTWPAMAVLGTLGWFIWVSSRLPGRLFFGALRSFSWLILLTLAANLWLTPDAAGVPVWPPRLTGAGASAAGLNALRLVILFGLGAWLSGTTSPLALTGAIGRVAAPLGALGLPVGDLVLVMGLGLRLLPDLLEAGGRVRLAQQARGVGVGRGWRERWRGAEAVALALFAVAFRRADELALAMEARGYQSGRTRVTVARSRIGWPDRALLLACILVVALFVWLGRR